MADRRNIEAQRSEFDKVYDSTIVGGEFAESDAYYKF
jgi:hypothetical protein